MIFEILKQLKEFQSHYIVSARTASALQNTVCQTGENGISISKEDQWSKVIDKDRWTLCKIPANCLNHTVTTITIELNECLYNLVLT